MESTSTTFPEVLLYVGTKRAWFATKLPKSPVRQSSRGWVPWHQAVTETHLSNVVAEKVAFHYSVCMYVYIYIYVCTHPTGPTVNRLGATALVGLLSFVGFVSSLGLRDSLGRLEAQTTSN